MTRSTDTLNRAARQHLETSRLFGVDFMPLRDGPAASPRPSSGGSESRLTEPIAVPADASSRARALEELRVRHDAACPHCTSASSHQRTVFGEGNPCAELMFVGEAPGEEEDRTGRPFVGKAGQKLDEIIRAMGMARGDVYIANILKSRPPENRTPMQHEIEACGPFLAEQIRIIRPAVLVALGGPAAKTLLGTETGITRLRGQWSWYRDGDLLIHLMPTFHPAYVLRNYTLETRKKVWSDMQAVVQKIAELRHKPADIA